MCSWDMSQPENISKSVLIREKQRKGTTEAVPFIRLDFPRVSVVKN
jgi:hypothetical protein